MAGPYAFVANVGAGTLSKIDLSTFTKATTDLTLSNPPEAVDADDTYVYAADNTGGLSTIDPVAFDVVGSPLATGHSCQFMKVGKSKSYGYLVGASSSGTLVQVDLSTMSVVTSVTGFAAGGVYLACDVDPTDTYAYVCAYGTSTLYKIDLATSSVAASVGVGLHPAGVSVDSTATYAYVSNKTDATISKVQLSDMTVVATLTVGSAPVNFVIDSTSTYGYVCDNGLSSAVTQVQMSDFTVVTTTAIASGAGPNQAALDSLDAFLYTANYGSSNVTKLAVPAMTVVSSLATATNAVSIVIPSSAPVDNSGMLLVL